MIGRLVKQKSSSFSKKSSSSRSLVVIADGKDAAAAPVPTATAAPAPAEEIATEPAAAYPAGTVAPSSLLNDPTFDGKFKLYSDFHLPITLDQYYAHYVSDQAASYSFTDFYKDLKDYDISSTQWSAGCVLLPRDEFELPQAEEFARERLVSAKTPVGAGSHVTTERFHRYYFYPDERVMVMRGVNASKGMAFVDTFAGYEWWIVQEAADGASVRVRMYSGIIYSKPPFSFMASQIRKACDVACVKSVKVYEDKLKLTAARIGGNGGKVVVVAAVAVKEQEEQQQSNHNSTAAASSAQSGGGVVDETKIHAMLALLALIAALLVLVLLAERRSASATEQLVQLLVSSAVENAASA